MSSSNKDLTFTLIKEGYVRYKGQQRKANALLSSEGRAYVDVLETNNHPRKLSKAREGRYLLRSYTLGSYIAYENALICQDGKWVKV